MPIDVASGKKLAQQLGMSPPADWVAAGNEDQWYKQMLSDAVDSGDPRALKAAGLYQKAEGMGYGEGPSATGEMGYRSDFMNAAPSSEWLGKRKPTPAELRRYGAEQHASYVSGGGGQDEDYARMSDAQLSRWIKSDWDSGKGGFFAANGQKIGKPTEAGGSQDPYHGQGAGSGGGGGGGGQPAPPPQPTTVGSQLSMTGNPLQDMLIQQFNTGQNSTYQQGNNIFGLGEDRAVGGTGANADINQAAGGGQTATAQNLTGGGLWYGQDKNTFGGWDATKNQGLEGVKQTKQQQQAAKSYNQTQVAAAPWQKKAVKDNTPQSMGGMLYNQYQGQ